MKSIEDQIRFVDKVLLPFFGIKSIIDYDSTFEITSEINLKEFNLIISEFRQIFPAKEFSLHKTKYKIETSNQALCILKKCMELIQLPYTIDTITKNRISFKQVRLIRTNTNLYNYIQRKMSEIRSHKLSSNLPVDKNEKIEQIGINYICSSLKNSMSNCDIRGEPPNPKYVVSPWQNSTIEPDINLFHDLKPSKVKYITLHHKDLLEGVESVVTHKCFLECNRIVNSYGICKINLKMCSLLDKHLSSIKIKFKSKKINEEPILSDYYINTITQGCKYEIRAGHVAILEGTFYNNKELLPECVDDGKQMFLLQKILKYHNTEIYIHLDKATFNGLKFVNLELVTEYVKFNDKVNELLNCSISKQLFNSGKSSSDVIVGVEQFIRNEKELYNKTRMMAGMAGNGYAEFVTMDEITEIENSRGKFSIVNPIEKKVIKIGNLTGYETTKYELPESPYDFCVSKSLNKYTQVDPEILYSYTSNENNKFSHSYEILTKKSSKMLVRHDEFLKDTYSMSGLNIQFDDNIKPNTHLYFLVLNTKTMELEKTKFDFTIHNNVIVTSPEKHICFNFHNEMHGLLLEIESDLEEEPYPNIITVSFQEYSFNKKINQHLTKHDINTFELKNLENL